MFYRDRKLPGDDQREQKFLDRLGPAKQRNIEMLESRVELKEGLDALKPFTGLWARLSLGTWNRIFNMSSDKVPLLAIFLESADKDRK